MNQTTTRSSDPPLTMPSMLSACAPPLSPLKRLNLPKAPAFRR